MKNLVNLAAFQLGWLACVLGAAQGAPWFGPPAVAALVGGQAAIFGRPPSGWPALAVAALIGYAADSALVLAGLLSFPPHAALGAPAALWMTALWVNFAATLDGALGWLRGRPLTAALLGAVGGPAAYGAGERLGAVELSDPSAPAWVALEWALATPILILLARPDRQSLEAV